MGVSIMMRPGSIMRSKGEPVDVTPGLRSSAVVVLEETFGSFPMELHTEDAPKLELMANGARVYEIGINFWDELLQALGDYGVITLNTEY